MMPKPRTYDGRVAARKALDAAYVMKTTDYDRDDDDDSAPYQKVRFGLPAPVGSLFHWGFRAIKDAEGFSLVWDRQDTCKAEQFQPRPVALKMSKFIDDHVIPVLQHKARELDSRDTNFYHFHFVSEFGDVKAVITTHGPSGYVYGCAYIGPAT